jgi:hypothetical protein
VRQAAVEPRRPTHFPAAPRARAAISYESPGLATLICPGRLSAETQEVVINTGSGSHTIGDLREKVEQDQVRLASLDAESPECRQLRRQITRNTMRLRELEEDLNRRAGTVRDLRLLFILVGGVLTFAGWGSWTVLIGPSFALFGVWLADRLPDHFYRW